MVLVSPFVLNGIQHIYVAPFVCIIVSEIHLSIIKFSKATKSLENSGMILGIVLKLQIPNFTSL